MKYAGPNSDPLPLITLLMIGSNGIIATLVPYSAEVYPLQVRGRGTGMAAGMSKFGGLMAQALAFVGLAPALTPAALLLTFPLLTASAMIARFAPETRERSLDVIDCSAEPIAE